MSNKVLAATLVLGLAVLVFTLAACSGCNNTDKPGAPPVVPKAPPTPEGAPQGGRKEAPPESAPAPIDPATVATVGGTVHFDGEAPAPSPIALTAECSALHGGGKTPATEEIVLNSNKTLKNVFVYIKTGLEGRKFPVPSEIVVLDQKGCVYVPHVFAARAGQVIEVRSSDPATHNVNCVAARNSGFNKAMPAGISPLKAKFQNPELLVKFKCDIHPWMGAYLHVAANPYFAITGDDGSFRIGNLPPGSYTLEAVHESLKTKSMTFTLGEKESKSVEFRFQR